MSVQAKSTRQTFSSIYRTKSSLLPKSSLKILQPLRLTSIFHDLLKDKSSSIIILFSILGWFLRVCLPSAGCRSLWLVSFLIGRMKWHLKLVSGALSTHRCCNLSASSYRDRSASSIRVGGLARCLCSSLFDHLRLFLSFRHRSWPFLFIPVLCCACPFRLK